MYISTVIIGFADAKTERFFREGGLPRSVAPDFQGNRSEAGHAGRGSEAGHFAFAAGQST
jgi:hypothetical protein